MKFQKDFSLEMKLSIVFFLICSIVFVFSQTQGGRKPAPAHLQVKNCHPDHPYASVGDFFISDNNFTSLDYLDFSNIIPINNIKGW